MRRRLFLSSLGLLGLSACAGSGEPAPPVSTPTAPPSRVPPASQPASAIPTASPSPSSAAVNAELEHGRQLARALSPAQRAGQTICVGVVPADSPSYIAGLIDSLCLGGIFLLGHWSDRGALTKMLDAVHEAHPQKVGALIATDHEGGEIQNVLIPGVGRVPAAADLAAQGESQAQEASATGARELAALGIHMIFSPVGDVVDPRVGAANKPIAGHKRGFGTDPAKVSRFVQAVIRGHHSAGVVSTVKHFPGIGRITEDTDFKATGITDEWTTADDPYLQPFTDAFAQGCEAVMIASAYFPKIDAKNLALFSRPVMTDLLRTRLGYQGLIVSDDVGSSVSVFGVPGPLRARRHVEAGGDFVLTASPELAEPMVKDLTGWAKEQSSAERLTDAAAHVLAVKVRHGLVK